ncbi:putative beta-galactosidase A [Aspergillus multicolor]|uniref:glycoside hydrolase family 35 protein n=1 Tax=Aspergillus multicolor TaxID=41759 RepID=UPI003CCD897B
MSLLVMLFFSLLRCILVVALGTGVSAAPRTGPYIDKREAPLQNIASPITSVTWDDKSVTLNGERIMIYSGEFHPFRLPSPGLWLDVLQKIKALGFNTVSFYVDWALLEGKQGNFSADGIFALDAFFQAATESGLYLIARPGPYINAEAYGGGFPGWLQRMRGDPRVNGPDYTPAIKSYLSNIGPILAKAQITNGGPIILVQPENEYSLVDLNTDKTLDPSYMQTVEDALREVGIVVPLISNDALNYGNWAPGTGEGAVDIYGHDGYPVGLKCADPDNWNASGSFFPQDWWAAHLRQSPSTPYAIMEFQGGSYDQWSGAGYDACAVLLNHEFERVYYKNDYASGVKIFNVYMVFGGTNWGNLGFPEGYTSYDYGAAIKEDRTVWREKYSNLNTPTNHSEYANTDEVMVTAVTTDMTKFWVVRHTDYTSTAGIEYTLRLTTTAGNLSLPQLGGKLTLPGRDSKIHVTDYSVGSYSLLYSTAEIFTWKEYASETVLLIYGGVGETHELALNSTAFPQVLEGRRPVFHSTAGQTVMQWNVTTSRTIVKIDSLLIYLLDRNAAYNYWVLNLPDTDGSRYSTASSVIVKAGYLLRTAEMNGSTLALRGDLNVTTTVEVIGSPSKLSSVTFNGKALSNLSTSNTTETLSGQAIYQEPNFTLPDLSSLDWKTVDSLPEIQSTYNDSRWTLADHTTTNNTETQNLTTPTSLYSSDYGYNIGSLLYRGHFAATSNESYLYINIQGGDAFGISAWIGDEFLGSYAGASNKATYAQNFSLPALTAGKNYVFTVLHDHMGNEQNGHVYGDNSKRPRGILDYALGGRDQSAIAWKLTGNLGGEDYKDRTRGPLNEGGLYAERQGWHLPQPPTDKFESGSPFEGVSKPGVAFYFASFDLDMPEGYDIPLEFAFPKWSASGTPYRCLLYVNGYLFGKYLHAIGPQTNFPVPEGILDYHGTNYIALSLWAQDANGAALDTFLLRPSHIVQTGYGAVELSPMAGYELRENAYSGL